MNYFLNCLKKYKDFSGRASRREFWMFLLFASIFEIFAIILDNLLGTTFSEPQMPIHFGWLYLLYILVIFLPFLATFVRRMHDIGKSGWILFVYMIPLAGAIWLLVLLCAEGTKGDNKYGTDPKSARAA